MVAKHPAPQLILRLLLILAALSLLLTACLSAEEESPELPEIQTQLLVRAPEIALPLNKPVTVRSRVEAREGVSHVELYAVQMPGTSTEILIRADEAPFEQTTFTASQTFTPREPGRYVIKVVGYNHFGVSDTSDYIGFEVK